MKDYYSTLGVSKTASQEEIKAAYRKLAAKHHPDRGGDKELFQEVQAAYDTLGDPEKRQQYDNPVRQQFYSNFGQSEPNFEDLFSAFRRANFYDDIFGPKSRRRNKTLNLQTSISLEDAFNGKELIANVTLPNGKDQTLQIKIPPGINDGTTLRLAGMGDDSIPDAPRGDLHLTITVLPHPIFRRAGADLIRIVTISCIDAMLGKTMRITTIDNRNLDVNIVPGTQHMTVLAINGHGMPHVQDNRLRGRLLLEINVIVPSELTEEQKNILKQHFT